MPFLHDHKRRVPTQDVDCSIVVGMDAEAAGATVERRLAFTAFPVYGSAGRTGLRGMARIDLAKVSAPFFKFVGQHGFKSEPALIKDRSVEARLLPDVGSRSFRRSLGTAGHVAGGEVFQHDRAVAASKAKAGLVSPVLPDARRPRLQGRDTAAGLRMAGRVTLAARHGALRTTLGLLDLRYAGREPQMLTGRKRQRVGDTPVYSNGRQVIGRGGVLDLTGKGDVPAARGKAYRRVHRRAAQGPGIAELHPSDLGQAHGGPLTVQPLRFYLSSLKAEGVVRTLLAGRWVSRTACKEVGIGPIQIAQSLLLRRHMHGGNPVEGRPQQRQFPSLGDVVQPTAGLALVVPPPIPALLKGEVVDQSHNTGELPEQGFLSGVRRKLVSEGAMDHGVSLSLGPRSAMVEYRTGRHVVYMLHVHLVFVTKYRRDVLSDLANRDLKRIFAKVCRDFEAELVECDGEDDHVHLLVHYPPKVALSKLVNSLKGVSSRLLREARPEITGRYHKGVLWSPSYFAASCGGAPLSVIAEYVKSQREAAQGRSRVPPRPEGRGIPRGFR